MPQYEQSGTIQAEPDTLFEYLSDVEHLPDYLPVISEAHEAGPEQAEVTLEETQQLAQGWLRVDGLNRRMEWGTQGTDYHGWLGVEPAEGGEGSVVTIHVSQGHTSDADDDLIEAIDNIRLLVDTGEISSA